MQIYGADKVREAAIAHLSDENALQKRPSRDEKPLQAPPEGGSTGGQQR